MVGVPVRYDNVQNSLQNVENAVALVSHIKYGLANVQKVMLSLVVELPKHILVSVLEIIDSGLAQLDKLFALSIEWILQNLVSESNLDLGEHCHELGEALPGNVAHCAIRHGLDRVQRVAVEKNLRDSHQ